MADVFESTKETEVKSEEGYLSKIVGDGNKYANVEELAKGAIHGNEYIQKLETEMSELRGELDKRVTAEEMVQQVKRETAEQQALAQKALENTTPQLDDERLSQLISTTIEQKNTQQVAQQNIYNVDQRMKEIYGADKAAEVVQQKANAMGVSVDKLADIAASSPEMFFNAIGVSQGTGSQPTPAPTVGTTNTEAVQTMNSGQKIGKLLNNYVKQTQKNTLNLLSNKDYSK